MMESNEGSIFVGGLPWDSTEDTLRDYFSYYGVVTNTVIVREETTGRSRGFCFVTYADPSVLDRSGVLTDKHIIGYTVVEAKRAWSIPRTGNHNVGRTSAGTEDIYSKKKIYVRGLPPTLNEQELREYFETFGEVRYVEVLRPPNNERPSLSGLVSFATEATVNKVLDKNSHKLHGIHVDVIRAFSKKVNSGKASAVNDVNRVNYLQPQTNSVGHPYSPSNGYGSAYGGYGAGGYENAGVPLYENTNTSNILYGNRPNQSPSYGASSGYQTPRSTSMASGYGNPNMSSNSLFAYGPDQNLSNGNQAYGNGMKNLIYYPAGSQHMSSGYEESNTNSRYQGAWRYNTPLADGGEYYGSGYGVAQPRQNQQRR